MLFGFASRSSSPRQGGPSADPAPPSEGDPVREEIGATLEALMPWGVSLLVHMALVVLAFFLVWQTIIPKGQQEIVPHVGVSKTPSAPVKLDHAEQSQSDSSSPVVPVVDPTVEFKPLTPGVTHSTSMVPADPGHSAIPICCGNRGTGETKGPYDSDGGNATKIVYLVDASGSMVDVLPFVINELKSVINKLEPRHQVTILFFSGEGVFEANAGGKAKGLRSADNRFKADATRWITLDNHQFSTGGRGSQFVNQALTQALSYKPEVVFLLSDNLTGGGLGATQHELFQDDIVDLIRVQNKSTPAARINTIQFLYEDPLVRAGLRGTLDRIADETDGEYRFISQRQLNLR